MFNIFIALSFVLSVGNAKTIMLIDTPVNVTHKEFVGQTIEVYNYDGDRKLTDGYKDHGSGMLSIVIAGERLANKLATKHKYVVCSDYKNYNIRCYELAIKIKADVVNYSGGGKGEVKAELELIKQLANAGTVMFFAAGNDGNDISKTPYYPASYAPIVSNITAVENVDSRGRRDEATGYSYYTKPYLGVNVMGAKFDSGYRFYTGTSPATALATHLYLKSLEK